MQTIKGYHSALSDKDCEINKLKTKIDKLERRNAVLTQEVRLLKAARNYLAKSLTESIGKMLKQINKHENK